MFFTRSDPYLTNVSERFLMNVTMIKFLINLKIKRIVRLKYPIILISKLDSGLSYGAMEVVYLKCHFVFFIN